MSDFCRLPDSELDVMLAVWQLGGEASALHSYLKRLEEKGFLACRKAGKVNVYTARVSAQDYRQSEGGAVLDKLYGGFLKAFTAALWDGGRLSEEVDGLSYREIAGLIGRNVSTVSREIRRNCTHMYDIPTYYPHTAQKKYLPRRSYCHRGMFHSQEVIEYIEEKLRATWSPEQIACTPCELKMPGWRTIYRWIYEKYLVKGNLKVLRRKGKSHGSKETRGKYNKGKSIRKRDKSVYSRP